MAQSTIAARGSKAFRHATLDQSRRAGRQRRLGRNATIPPGLAPAPHLQGALALRVAARPPGSAGHCRRLAAADAGRQTRHRRHALHLQVGDGCAGAGGGRQRARVADGGLARRRTGRGHPALWPRPRCHVAAGAGARGAVRQGRALCRAQAGAQHLRAHAPPLAPLPSGAQDRRADARARARSGRHREHHAHDVDDVRADARGVRAGAWRADVRVRLALCRRRGRHDRPLSLVHGGSDRLAHQDPPHHERERQRRQHQGHRQPPQLRDGQVFRCRGARGQALRSLGRGLRRGQHQELHLACRPQCRAGRHLCRSPHRLHADGRPRHRGRQQDCRPLRDGQCADAAAFHPAQLHGHGVPRDPPIADRHRAHDGRAGRESGSGGPAGRCAAECGWRHHPLRGREVLLRARARHPRRPLLRGAGRQDGGDRRSLRRRQVDRLAHPAAGSTTSRAGA